ncbi:hypothetical protein [Nocardioides stalactiti]|uniref:hypothetical protein n=1 Tax=Nocardioides stalactiti TaxID=2755356 RepID=UPI001600B302|nr:hypothetical protein [Nocardioides stalactiti]
MPERPAPLLLQRLLSVHRTLEAAGLPHAVGGALALAVHTRDPRFTADIDLNVTADTAHPEILFAALPDDLEIHGAARSEVRQVGQTRLWWRDPDTPLDLFLPVHPTYHELVVDRAEPARFLSDDILVLTATDLIVFKALFNRSKDWVDIETLIQDGSGDVGEAAAWIDEITGDHSRGDRLRRIRSDLPGAT